MGRVLVRIADATAQDRVRDLISRPTPNTRSGPQSSRRSARSAGSEHHESPQPSGGGLPL